MALLTNLEEHWRLNEASGDATGVHGGLVMTDTNTVTAATGKIGGARQFTAANSESLYNAAPGADWSFGAATQFEVAAWVYLDSVGANRVIIEKNGSSSTAFQMVYRTSVDRFRAYAGGTFVDADVFGSPSLATWYFVRIGWDGTNLFISVNNGTKNTTLFTGHAAAAQGAGALRIGTNIALTQFWDGRIDSLSVWIGGTVSDADATTLYSGGTGLDYPFAGTGSSALTGEQFWFLTSDGKIGRWEEDVTSDMRVGATEGTAIPDWEYSTGFVSLPASGRIKSVLMLPDGPVEMKICTTTDDEDPNTVRVVQFTDDPRGSEVEMPGSADLRGRKFRFNLKGRRAVTVKKLQVEPELLEGAKGG